ncbi:MAG: hypothetical protein PSV23_13305 [Brevundimonas sp.]|uniref:hypothetical protein n=1 Tax=Brevundimonas sp. TaxID=1871086 RepID=UPI0024896985|nr:hypothetical protein [Brevundimonas sp.]MDI1327762.1 hypothetical protein [Brevundimonas sp.]
MTPSGSAERSGAVIDTPKIVYAALMVSWTVGAFILAALIGWEGWTPGSIVIAGPVIGILFSATGILRSKRIRLERETLTYRPVWGRTLVIRKSNIETFDVFVLTAAGSGFLICKERAEAFDARAGARHNLGFVLMPREVLKSLREWLGRSS